MPTARRRASRLPRAAAALLAPVLALAPLPRSAPELPLPVAPPVAQRFDPGFAPWRARLAPAPPRVAKHAVPAPPATPAWAGLLQQAGADDPVAACRLALLLEDCRLARDVEAMVETRLSMATRERRDAEAAHEIAALQASATPLHAACGGAPPELVAQGWSWLLRAALAGHEPSMLRFVTDPPFDAARPHEAQAALAAWRTHAGPLLAQLLERGSPAALTLAFRAAQGAAFVGDEALQARDAGALLRYGSALAVVYEDDPSLTVQLEAVERELDETQKRQARAEGLRLASRFLVAGAEPEAGREDCAAGWPGPSDAWLASDG